MNPVLKHTLHFLKNHPFFSAYFNALQWHIRGKKYSRREISSCYQQLYDDLADLALVGEPSNILEFGCGDAYLLRTIYARGRGAKLYGCDFSKTQLIAASALLNEAVFEVQNITSTTYRDKAFDVAIGVSVLMYLNPSQLTLALKEIGRISRRVILVEMNCWCFNEAQVKQFYAAQDGRFDHDYEKECMAAGFININVDRCEKFWDPEINALGEMGYAMITADHI